MASERGDWRHLRDEELAAHALQGREEAWSEIIRRHTHRVLITLLARGVRLHDAEDLAQETWSRLVQQQRAGRLRELRLPGIAVAQAGWLAREADRTRARRNAIAGFPVSIQSEPLALNIVDPGADVEETTLHRERLRVIEEELRRCPSRSREIFYAVYGPEARGHREAAGELGISVQRLRQVLCEVRARLRRVLEEREGEKEP